MWLCQELCHHLQVTLLGIADFDKKGEGRVYTSKRFSALTGFLTARTVQQALCKFVILKRRTFLNEDLALQMIPT